MRTTDLAIQLAQQAVGCNACFESLPVRRAGISLPQPFAVGRNYRKGGIALIGINPGAAMDGGYKEARRVALDRFASGETAALTAYWDALASDAANHWNPRYLSRIRSLGLRVEDLLVGNLALCATAENKYPKAMLRNCWARHSEGFLSHFAPGTLVLMGSESTVGEFVRKAQALLPSLRAVRIAHYAHREGATYEKAECLRVLAFLQAGHASSDA